MRIPALSAAALLLASVTATGHAQLDIPAARIDSVFGEMNRSDRPGCSLGVFHDGAVAYAKGYGMANLEYGIALAPRSVFHIASISKQFATFAVELLVSEGRVTWDDDIRQYVPELPDYGHTITLQHLAQHTSGVRDQWELLLMAGWRWEADLVTQRDALDVIARQQALNFEPGEQFLYSNSGFTLLAAVVERVSGQTLRAFAEERIFTPLGMTATHFHDDHQMIVPDRAYGYRIDNVEGWKISIPDFAIVGASSLFTTVEDMANWDRNFREHTVGDRTLFERFLTAGVLDSGEPLTYAHGIAVFDYRGERAIGHAGADAGYRSDYIRFPERDLGIVCFCNFAAARPGQYTRRVADVLLEGTLVAPLQNDDPEVDVRRWGKAFQQIAGYYRDPRSDRPVHVFLHRGAARITRGRGIGMAGAPLVPLDDRRFRIGAGPQVAQVESAAEAPVALTIDARRYPRVDAAPEAPSRESYIGTYWSEELGTEYRIELDSTDATGLRLVHRKHPPRRLTPAFTDAFQSSSPIEGWFTFTRGADGQVNGVSWSTDRVWKMQLTRR